MKHHSTLIYGSIVILYSIYFNIMQSSLVSSLQVPSSSRRNNSSNLPRYSAISPNQNHPESFADHDNKSLHIEPAAALQSNDNEYNRKLKSRASAALFAAYFTVMGAKCALPSTLSLITAQDSGLAFKAANHNEAIGKLLSISTFSVAMGKLLLGPIIDSLGGILSLQIALAILASLMAFISFASSFQTFAYSWVIVDFVFSSCWAACVNAIHDSFHQDSWSSKIGLIAIGARLGNALSFFTFASILSWAGKSKYAQQSWRLIFAFSSLMQIVPIILLTNVRKLTRVNNEDYNSNSYVHDDTHLLQHDHTDAIKSNQSPFQLDSLKKAVQVLKLESRTLLYWAHFTSRTSLMLIASFLLFVPTYMSNCFGLSSAVSASVGSAYAIGCLISVSLGSEKFAKLQKKGKMTATLSSLGILLICSLFNWMHVVGVFPLQTFAGVMTMFFWGVSFAIPFYIPPSLYAMRQGGRQSSATIADSFDLGGFLLLAWFNGFVANRDQSLLIAWSAPFTVLTICTLVSIISLTTALYLESDVIQ